MAKKRKRQADGSYESPDPVKGEVIPKSKIAILGMGLFCVVLMFACGGMLLDRLVFSEESSFMPFRLTWWGIILALIGLGIGVIGSIAAPIEFLFPQSIVLGKHVVQLVRKGSSGEKVELQIPYLNIAEVVYEQVGDDWQIGIDFNDAEDPDTYAKDPSQFDRQKEKGRDCIIDGSFTLGLEEIAGKLNKLARKARKAQKEAENEEVEDEE